MVVELLATLDIAAGVVHPTSAHRTFVSRFAGHVGLGSDDGHDVLSPAGLVEVEDPVHVAVVGDAEGWLSVRHRRVHQILDTRRTIEHGELGVGVQMRKRPLRHRPSFRHVRTYTGVVPPDLAIYPVGGSTAEDDGSAHLVVQGLPFLVPERIEEVEKPDQDEEGAEQLERAQHRFGEGPDRRPGIAQAVVRAVADCPHPDGHHADRLAAAAAAEDGAIDQVEQARDEERQERDAAVTVGSPLHREVNLQGVTVPHQDDQDHRDRGEDQEVDQITTGPDTPWGVGRGVLV